MDRVMHTHFLKEREGWGRGRGRGGGGSIEETDMLQT